MGFWKTKQLSRNKKYIPDKWSFVLVNTAVWSLILLGLIYWSPILLYPEGNDWNAAFRPAALELLAGRNPYTVPGFFGPPWLLIPFIPLSLFPEQIGLWTVGIFNLSAFGFVAWKFGARLRTLALLLVTPQVLWGSHMGNVDWIVSLGLVLPPQVGLFFVLVKPQIGWIIAVYWLLVTWQKHGFSRVIRTFLPVCLCIALSLLAFGLWPLKSGDTIGKFWNLAWWPYAIPVGLVLLVKAVRNHKFGYAITATPFLTPYLATYSFPLPVLGLLPSELETTAAILGLWVIWLLRGPV